MSLKLSKSFSRFLKNQKKVRRLIETSFLRIPKQKFGRRRRVVIPKPALGEVADFGSNPGRLRMKIFVPKRVPPRPALVLFLHGCRQTPESFDLASGFSKLAAQRGFILLYPEQREANNSQRCFNWFRPSAIARDRGELMSIKQMINHACRQHHVDRSRVYVAGLSAGGAMTSALLVTYPDLFAGGAIFAGMPYGAARDAISALRVMKSGPTRSPREWGDLVRTASPERKRWPTISIWQGSGDRTVHPDNAIAATSQWLDVAGIDTATAKQLHKPWGNLVRWDGFQKAQVSVYTLRGFGHGLPVKQNLKSDPFVIEAGISAPLELLRLWGLRR
ncbi:extracellular catalytic domain type 1 short-chain-length polyhydroxyalkanoate depolymerase [Rhizobium grahamii]|uniref:Esterase, PHB depolymerase family protein n=1 Tax=Rhizobium grahamii CCGE 502 TaxID=990285 RepID=S3HF12_9HYPH|nr:PHB depolymerase family esterase [Rhizobium grahamii]EPE96655.1 esterase, PHB depolymerase family protein [Rhizobium grahamii CCGE 502]